jgi:pyridoxal phosphate enzyme (YggS family)
LTDSSIAENLARVEDQIAAACRAANRPRGEVELMAVSKTHPADRIAEAATLGLRLFGESKVQEWQSKSAAFPHPAASQTGFARPGVRFNLRSQIRVHLIGHLQSNKAAKAAEIFDAIDSVDSLKLAERLNEAAAKIPKRLPILLEIKLSPEESKAGLTPGSAELAQLLERLPDLPSLDPQGLMTIAPLDVPQEATRACFRQLHDLRDRLAADRPRLHLPVLSMGMSGDFSLAIAEGATRIRVGTSLFGAREYPSPASPTAPDHPL